MAVFGSRRGSGVLLADRPGPAARRGGAGKTTLLWRLAAHASARTPDEDLAPPNGLVPLVVPLRALRPVAADSRAPAELSGAAGPATPRAST